jgi:regulatory protein
MTRLEATSEPSAGDAERALDDALGHCYRALGRRDQTCAQLERLLRRRGVEEEVAARALTELRRLGAVDDARYARNFVHDRRELDGWGAERIRERLEAVGVEREVIEAAVGEAGESELEAAVALLGRRLSEPPADERERARAFGLLVRKGYESELAYEAVRRFERSRAD